MATTSMFRNPISISVYTTKQKSRCDEVIHSFSKAGGKKSKTEIK